MRVKLKVAQSSQARAEVYSQKAAELAERTHSGRKAPCGDQHRASDSDGPRREHILLRWQIIREVLLRVDPPYARQACQSRGGPSIYHWPPHACRMPLEPATVYQNTSDKCCHSDKCHLINTQELGSWQDARCTAGYLERVCPAESRTGRRFALCRRY